MAVARRQYATGGTMTSTANITTGTTAALASPALAGSALVAGFAVDKASGTFTPPAGWTVLVNTPGVQSSLLVVGKVAVGGETTASASWATAAKGFAPILIEYTGTDGTTPFGPVTAPAYVDVAGTSISLGPLTADAVSLPIVIGSIDSITGTGTQTNAFQLTATGWTWVGSGTRATSDSGGVASPTGAPGLSLAEANAEVTNGAVVPATAFTWPWSDETAFGMFLLREAAATGTGAITAVPGLATSSPVAYQPSVTVAGAPAGGTTYTLAYAGATAAPTLPADVALTAGNLTAGPDLLLVTPYTGTTSYDPNKVWSATFVTTAATLAASVSAGAYTEITVSRTGGMVLKALRLKAARGGSTTPRGFSVRSSVDGYTADLVTADVPSVRPTLTQYTADISALGTQTSVTFRVYQYAPAAGSSLEFDDLEVDYATVVATPAITVIPDLVSSTPQAYAPTATVAAPTSNAVPDLAVSLPVAYAPAVTSTVTVAPDLATSTPTAYAPIASTVAAVTPALVSRMLGIPDATSVTLTTNTTNATSVRGQASTDATFATGVISGTPGTPNVQGNTQLTVAGLAAGTAYYTRVGMTDTNGVESFSAASTVPFTTDAPGVPGNISFTFGSCDDAVDGVVWPALAARNDDFFLHIGDWPQDTSVSSYADGTGTSVTNFRNQFTKKIRAAGHQSLYAKTPMSFTPSDHDGMTNGSTAAKDPTAWTNFNSVVREMLPLPGIPATTGLYRTWTRRRVRFIQIDTRSFKGTADTTALGATQKQWLKDQITAANEPVIVIVQADSSWIGATDLTNDDWPGFPTERTELANFFTASGKNIVMLGGDAHSLAADNGSHAPGGVAYFQAAPLDNSASQKGGPFTTGPYPASGVSTVVQQYGRVVVTDPGTGSIGVTFTGYSADGTQRVTLTKTYQAPTPASVLAIGTGAANHFELQMARSGDATWTPYTQAQIGAGYSESPYFTTVRSGTAVQFSVPLDAPLVGTSTGPRAELREDNADGSVAGYDINTGTHEFHGFSRIMTSDCEIVAAQLHNGSSDRIALRTQVVSGSLRLRWRVNGSSIAPDLASPYTLGTEFEWKIRVVDGAISLFYNDMTTPMYTAPAGTLLPTAGVTTWYFKTGAYAQATGTSTQFATTELRGLTVTHTASAPAAITASPGIASSTATAFAPAVTAAVTASPGVASSTATALAPAVTTTVTVSPGRTVSTWVAFDPTATVAGVVIRTGPVTHTYVTATLASNGQSTAALSGNGTGTAALLPASGTATLQTTT